MPKTEVEGIDAIRAKEKVFAGRPVGSGLLHGSGLRISECLDIQIQDLDLCSRTLPAYGKGGKK